MSESTTKKYWFGVGRRKTAVALVRIYEGEKSVLINGQKNDLPNGVLLPLELVGKKDAFSISANVSGGGKEGQLEAIRHGIARALERYNTEFRTTLKKAGLLTRDPREKERKKPGLKGARRAPQFSKR
ncbi:MAG: 30S ribosomal protein S9 [Patescibacteria group bacterium]|jgi:small subunit ribosomal protein S9